MEPFTTFSNCVILEKAKPDQGAPKAEVKGPAQPSIPPAMPTNEPAIPTILLAMPTDEPAIPTIPPAMLTDEPVIPTAPPETTNNQKGTKGHEYPNWTKIHPSHPVASVGHAP